MQIKHQNSNTDINKQIPLLDKNDVSNNTINNNSNNLLKPNKQTKEEINFNKQFYGNNYWDR